MSHSAVEFIKTPHCRREAHCGTCRNLEGGRAWRQRIAERFIVPEVDWLCPRGNPWGWTGPSHGLGDTVAKVIKAVTFGRVKPCGGCGKRRVALNRLVPYRQGRWEK